MALLALLALESLPQPQLSIMELVTCLWHMSNFSAGTGHVPSVTPYFQLLVDQNTQVHARPIAVGRGGGTQLTWTFVKRENSNRLLAITKLTADLLRD
jgi:hypothetical protein